MSLIARLLQSAHRFVVESADPRVAGWPLMGSPSAILTIVAAYVAFVRIVGPRYMRDRKPYQIKSFIITYNIFMVIANGLFLVVESSNTYFGGGYSWFCASPNSGSKAQQKAVITVGYYYVILKVVELMDTVFFVLTKKFSNISHLHVIHHSLVAFSVWLAINFGATGQNAFFLLINCFVHLIMYAYYAMAALGLQKYLWWKRYLTQLQMIQFIALIIHGSIPIFYDCGSPPFFGYLTIFEASLFFGLFFNFYSKAYKVRATSTAENHGDGIHEIKSTKTS